MLPPGLIFLAEELIGAGMIATNPVTLWIFFISSSLVNNVLFHVESEIRTCSLGARILLQQAMLLPASPSRWCW